MKTILILILALTFLYGYNNYFPLWLVNGVYISNAKEPIGDGPEFGDTLKLLNNYTFKSKSWGNGTFKLKHSLRGTRIVLSYKEYGYDAVFASYFTRTLFLGKPKIVVFSDLNYYIEKE